MRGQLGEVPVNRHPGLGNLRLMLESEFVEQPSSGLPNGQRVAKDWPSLAGWTESDTAGNCRSYLGLRAKLSFDDFVESFKRTAPNA
jgi:hypothetical protein